MMFDADWREKRRLAIRNRYSIDLSDQGIAIIDQDLHEYLEVRGLTRHEALHIADLLLRAVELQEVSK